MNKTVRWTLTGLVLVAAVGMVAIKQAQKADSPAPEEPSAPSDTVAPSAEIPRGDSIELTEDIYQQDHEPSALPKLIELGSVSCRNCKKMAVILDEIKVKYQDKLTVLFYDVKKDPDMGKLYGIRLIPAQVFIDTSGQEVFRHEGFFSGEEIEAVLESMGVSP
ncbi:thioredoxin family protein [bacterium]|nr:thioredoxin family protein [bacterium]